MNPRRLRQPGWPFAARLWPMLWLALLLGAAPRLGLAEPLTLNFQDVDIQVVIDYVAQETGANFIVDPRVKGKVTLVSGSAVDPTAVYDIFLSMLRVHGYAAIDNDGWVKIVPDELAKQAEVPTVDEVAPARALNDSYVTRVILLKHVQAGQLVPILRPLVPSNGHLAASSETNSLVVSDTAANVRRLAEIARRIDANNRREVEVIKLEQAAAAEVVSVLEGLGEAAGKGATPSRVIADERSNSLLLSGDAEARAELRAIIRQLDVPVSGGNTQVVRLKHTDAEELAEVLQRMVDGRPAAASASPGATGTAAARPRTATRGTQDSRVSIQAHPGNNALLISGPGEEVRSLLGIIPQLDVRRPQVLVEAVIAEVSSDQAAELGVQWGLGSTESGVGIVNFNRTGSGIIDVAAATNGFLEGTLDAPPSLADGLFLGGIARSGSQVLSALVRALSSNSANNILSTPTLLTLDNAEAEIVVGQNVPFLSGRAIEDSGQAYDSIERQDVGVTLRVTPQVNSGDVVRLEIEQEVSQIASGAASAQGAADLITNKRSLRTSVVVQNGEMVVLGGLIDSQLVQTNDKVPGLGDMPVLGGLFRYETAKSERRNLMLFLHPVIVRDAETHRDLTARRYQDIRAAQLRSRGEEVLLMDADNVPVMPEWDALTRLPPPYEAQGGPGRPLAPPGSDARSAAGSIPDGR